MTTPHMTTPHMKSGVVIWVLSSGCCHLGVVI
jgi:hypothetical protein